MDFYDTDGTGDSYYKENTPSYDSVAATKRTTKTLDSIVVDERLSPADLIKIDTQGSELDILRGGLKALQNCSLVYLECPTLSYNEGAPNFQEYSEFLLGHSFVPYEVCELHYSYGALIQMDVLFVKKEHLRRMSSHSSQVPRFLE